MIKDVIENCEKAQTIAEIKKCERLVSKGGYYKIKIPPYRFGIYIYAGTIEFIKFGTRENFYKDFPPH